MGQRAIIHHAPSSGRERQRVFADLGPGSHRLRHGLKSGKAQLRILPELAAHVSDTPQPMARRLRLLTHGLKNAHPLRGLPMPVYDYPAGRGIPSYLFLLTNLRNFFLNFGRVAKMD